MRRAHHTDPIRLRTSIRDFGIIIGSSNAIAVIRFWRRLRFYNQPNRFVIIAALSQRMRLAPRSLLSCLAMLCAWRTSDPQCLLCARGLNRGGSRTKKKEPCGLPNIETGRLRKREGTFCVSKRRMLGIIPSFHWIAGTALLVSHQHRWCVPA